jgi:acyl-coenzyme A synthetase/AMP-(fatty) acid ligase
VTAGYAMPPTFADVVTSAERRASYVAAGLWDGTTLAGQVARHAREAPAATAVVDESGRRDYRTLCRDAAALAGALGERGVEPGAVVSIQLPNRYEAVVAAVAVQSLGAVINPLLPNYRLKELADVMRRARPRAIVTPGVYRGYDHRELIAEVVADVAPETGAAPVHVVVGDDPGGALAFDSLVDGAGATLGPGRAEAVSEVIFTSGTEAEPKAVMHTEQTTNFSVRVASHDLAIGPDDVVWMPSPVGHSTGFNYGVRFALYHRLPLVLQDRWDADAAVELVERERCSYTLAATTFLRDLTEASTRASATLDSLRCFGCGGAPVPPALVDAAGAHGIQVLRLYGSTEVLVATWNRPESSLEHRRMTDGVAMSHVEVEVRGDGGTSVPREDEGELVTRGPNTCVGFYDDVDRTAATFDADGWVRSGDVVTMNGAGYVTVVGRRKEIIIRGGLNIAPREIEELLVAFPEVERAAVVGLPDDRLGERMCACVVLRSGASLDFDTMIDRLRGAGLARYKHPERLEVLDGLPTTPSGKVQKHEIVRALSTTHG